MDARIPFGPRLAAMIIDGAVVTIAIAIAGWIEGAFVGLVYGGPVIGLFYFASEAFSGMTIGKMVIGLRAGNMNGTPAPLGQLLLRFCCKHPHLILGSIASLTPLSFLGPLSGALGMVAFAGCFAAAGEHRQALHDQIANTAVYPKGARKPAPATPPAMPAL